MNKRAFIKLFSALIASPAISPFLTWAAKDKLKNWAGNLEYSTDRLYSASSLEQVRSYVKKQSKLKVLGTRHCFNNIADSTDNFLSVKSMDEVVALEPDARIVTAAGEVVKLSRQQDGQAFLGAVVGLGALGVITKITLDIQPTFMMRQYVYENLPLAE